MCVHVCMQLEQGTACQDQGGEPKAGVNKEGRGQTPTRAPLPGPTRSHHVGGAQGVRGEAAWRTVLCLGW